MRKRVYIRTLAIVSVVAAAVLATVISGASAKPTAAGKTATPIKHVVVIFQENVSFDHYFGTYPTAAGTDGQPFAARPGTPPVDGLLPATDASIPVSLQHTSDLTTAAGNPNLDPPQRLDSSPTGLPGDPGGQLTCDQDHNYSDEQQAFDNGKMDQFVQSVGTDDGSTTPFGTPCLASIVMDYYDGNTATGLWNYAQRYAMSDNSFGTTFGPSAPGAINLISGDTGDVDTSHESGNVTVATSISPNADVTPDGKNGESLTSDAQPYWDDCSTRDAVALSGENIGDLLNNANLSWGWFQGGFRPTTTFAAAATATGHTNQPTSQFIPDEFSGSFTGKVTPPGASNQALCNAVHPVGVAFGATADQTAPLKFGFKDDYIAHHEPFQYYATTANPHHLTIPTDSSGNDTLDGLKTVGTDTQTFVHGVPHFDTPNHNYDTSDFDQLVGAITAGKLPPSALPAVSFLKAPGYEDGHPAYSDPADEQAFVVKEIDALMQSPDWSSTVVFVNYDDSDGWYDHVYSGITNPSLSGADNLTNTKTGKISDLNPTSGQCGPSPQTAKPLAGEQGRCGLGPRIPMMAISPCASPDTVDHDLSDQASIINFVEYNWNLPSIPGSFDQALSQTDAKEGVPFDLAGLFDFSNCKQPAAVLDPATGELAMHGASVFGNQQGQDFAGGDLSSSDLTEAKLQGAFMSLANLSGADLRGTNAQGANLSGANLAGARLAGALLEGADLAKADLTGDDASGAQLQGANLSGANLTGVNLTGAKLTGTALTGVTWSNTTCPDGTNSSSDGGTCKGHLSS